MQLLNKLIEMIATFNEKGIPQPIKFRMIAEEESRLTIKIDRIIRSSRIWVTGTLF